MTDAGASGSTASVEDRCQECGAGLCGWQGEAHKDRQRVHAARHHDHERTEEVPQDRRWNEKAQKGRVQERGRRAPEPKHEARKPKTEEDRKSPKTEEEPPTSRSSPQKKKKSTEGSTREHEEHHAHDGTHEPMTCA